ncbi:MAG: hypothetical protein U5L09_09895 [Bacteroidales bacterium]|nr:hypothetical protein [Bacteroidales bacterium]
MTTCQKLSFDMITSNNFLHKIREIIVFAVDNPNWKTIRRSDKLNELENIYFNETKEIEKLRTQNIATLVSVSIHELETLLNELPYMQVYIEKAISEINEAKTTNPVSQKDGAIIIIRQLMHDYEGYIEKLLTLIVTYKPELIKEPKYKELVNPHCRMKLLTNCF